MMWKKSPKLAINDEIAYINLSLVLRARATIFVNLFHEKFFVKLFFFCVASHEFQAISKLIVRFSLTLTLALLLLVIRK